MEPKYYKTTIDRDIVIRYVYSKELELYALNIADEAVSIIVPPHYGFIEFLQLSSFVNEVNDLSIKTIRLVQTVLGGLLEFETVGDLIVSWEA